MAQTTTGATAGAASAQPSDFEEATYRKLSWRLLPLLLLCYLVAYLDRVNVGFAKLQMLKELGFSETIYGLGAGIFFFGYFLFEVPSNLILHRVGARKPGELGAVRDERHGGHPRNVPIGFRHVADARADLER